MGYYLFYTTHSKRRIMIKKRRSYVKSRTSPKGGKRGCLCADGRTYSSKCCDGSLEGQGIGNITGTSN